MVFASRRTMVDIDYLPHFLADDGYRHILETDAVVGDIVVYHRNGVPQHVGIVYELRDISPRHDGSAIEKLVLSQWGENGEYLHTAREVPPIYGNELHFWSERKRL